MRKCSSYVLNVLLRGSLVRPTRIVIAFMFFVDLFYVLVYVLFANHVITYLIDL